MFALKIIAFIIWLYILLVLSRTGLHFFKFVIGSVGLFSFLMFWVQPVITAPLSMAVTAVAGLLGDLSGMYDSYFQYSILFIPKDTTSVSLAIDYECSGVIEIMAFSCMLWFFPLYNMVEKLIVNSIGIAIIFLANVLRIFTICAMIYFYGNEIFYFAHTIFGRIIFYFISIALYFYVFTRAHVIRQKVGNFNYGNSDTVK
ncbi:MAG: exosortase family protein XrtG [Eubacteriales bacterium]|nr:exosortase family protein XrtG [Eubacteriales bacterium]MDD3200327.1 exosortase family protein XrtG [Eubacteriales bacterium]MDD4122627.1 exosortase family protein XrtG [Eubacteriales bacterium]MDD4630538.1 exosortase family protein XrtG [Eubacteriales bacterium]